MYYICVSNNWYKNLLVVKFLDIYATLSLWSYTVNNCNWYVAPGVKSFKIYCCGSLGESVWDEEVDCKVLASTIFKNCSCCCDMIPVDEDGDKLIT